MERCKVVWDEVGVCHAVFGSILSEDDQFIELVLSDGTNLRIAKSRIVKIEKPVERSNGRSGY